jgi:hypothetical protein
MQFINMFEMLFILSLGITFVLILVMVYYFKKQIHKIESKCDTMYEIINDIVTELESVKSISTYIPSHNVGINDNIIQDISTLNSHYHKIPVLIDDSDDNVDDGQDDNIDIDDSDSDSDSDSDIDIKHIDQSKIAREELIQSSFDYWWKAYPTKTARKASFKKWQSITKKMDDNIVTELTNHIVADVKFRLDGLANGDDRFIGFDRLHPSTYLNQERYNDDF